MDSPGEIPRVRATVDIVATDKDLTTLRRYLHSGPEWSRVKRLNTAYQTVTIAVYAVLGAVIGRAVDGWLTVVPIGLLIASFLLTVRIRTLRFAFARADAQETLCADAEGLTVSRPGESTRYDWAAFQDFHTSDTHLLLRRTVITGYVIPRRCFRSTDEADAFIGLAEHARSTH